MRRQPNRPFVLAIVHPGSGLGIPHHRGMVPVWPSPDRGTGSLSRQFRGTCRGLIRTPRRSQRVTYRPASRNNRLTASALSASDRGSPAIITRAAAKPSEPVTPAPGVGPFERAFSGELVQPVVQPAESFGVSPDGLSLGIVDDLLGVQEVAGSNPVSPIQNALNRKGLGRFSFQLRYPFFRFEKLYPLCGWLGLFYPAQDDGLHSHSWMAPTAVESLV